ncbi:response regulator containing a CheY-like receiver domain and an HTH DNA-binding domain [Owenweeksia hongkongensis DSM 17368]|uniref:Response regulator containing a CheY-like receiver domain and an HTH DNA-binding domain n=1 Tax=Owenweeksia hongkongensis (strain DSM 17368 / CIP 108786 / JCM 12287 / NRRL B-23963 / UST20020801) TaxID=926562 RepID=G8R491_OWEHD|nr:LuxR C-terminal-related transcriptional regulator [Owenweeksia hongkongensis]AEV34191.1 response regulator containing a CheY-like receiver domain and an HTH DNA-binding domain [Owenweeksia hongkongensis DSM 17368]
MSNTNQIQAGVADRGLEIFNQGDRTLATYAGHTYKFKDLPNHILNLIRMDLALNERAQKALIQWGYSDESERLEKYASCRFGGIDLFPDVNTCGELTPDHHDCPSRSSCPFNGVICVKPAGVNGEISPREMEVLKLIAMDYMEKEIAEKLEITQTGVAKHRKALFNKIGVQSSIGLTHWAITHNIIQPSYAI